ncbi:MAG: hypothetical protein AAFV07_05280 [Bacteroidota bacterium]
MQRIIFFLLGSVLTMPVFAGGGWTQGKGKGYLKVGQSWIIARQHFTDTGKLDPNTTFANYFTSAYIEHGLSDRLDVVGYVPFFARSLFYNTVSATTGETLLPGEAVNGIGDIDLSLKYALIKEGPFVLAASAWLGLPTGNSSGGNAGVLQTGDGEFNQMVRLDLSTSKKVQGINTYYSAFVGFNHRTRGFSDEFRYGIEAGASFLDGKLIAILRGVGIASLKNGAETAPENSTSLFANNVEYFSIQPELAWQFSEKWGVSASVGGAVFGRIILTAPMYSVGLYTTW